MSRRDEIWAEMKAERTRLKQMWRDSGSTTGFYEWMLDRAEKIYAEQREKAIGHV